MLATRKHVAILGKLTWQEVKVVSISWGQTSANRQRAGKKSLKLSVLPSQPTTRN
jgi:hypothetical protein